MNSELERLKAKGLSEIHNYYDAERTKVNAYHAKQLHWIQRSDTIDAVLTAVAVVFLIVLLVLAHL